NYGFSSRILHAYIPRRSFQSSSSPAIENGPLAAQLRCAGPKVVLYLASAKEYLQLNVVHNTLDRFPVEQEAPGTLAVTGLALTETGHVYASMDERSTNKSGLLGLTGLYELRYHASAKQVHWLPVKPTLNRFDSSVKEQGKFLMLWGTDGTNLIYSQTGQQGALFWAKPEIAKTTGKPALQPASSSQ